MSRGWRSEAFSGAAQPASAPGGAAQPTPPVVAIDVGDVASKRTDDQRVEGSEMYTAVEDGFWAFVVLFAAEFGLQDMHFISRTTRGTWHSHHAHLGRVEAWVVRLIRSTGLLEMGMPEENIHLTSQKSGPNGKGVASRDLQLTHMIDNDLECLWSVLNDRAGNSGLSIRRSKGRVIQYTRLRPVDCWWWHRHDDDWLKRCDSWFEVAGAAQPKTCFPKMKYSFFKLCRPSLGRLPNISGWSHWTSGMSRCSSGRL